MALLAGTGVGDAAQWVTVILFIEVARRAHKTLSRPELFVLFYMAAAVMASPFSGLMYNQFYVQSHAAIGFGIADKIPHWYAPSDPAVLEHRTFFDPAWYPAMGLILFSTVMGRLNGTILSYGLFRLASDVEKLPFPMAPIYAQGVTALAEQQSEEGRGGKQVTGNWRWRVFAVGGVIGLGFGAIYTALPTITSAFFGSPIQILPIPFVDFTPKTGGLLPAVPTGLSLDLGQFIIGMVLPFFAMVGSFIGLLLTIIANAFFLYPRFLPTWQHGDGTVATMFSNQMDFYLSFSMGIAAAIAIAGFYQLGKGLRETARRNREAKLLRKSAVSGPTPLAEVDPKHTRGDLPTRVVIGTYIFTALAYILVSGWLIHWEPHVMAVLVFFAFLYTPLLAYVTARLEGIAGQVVDIPMVREASFILSGYRGGVDIWFLPVPMPEDMRKTVFYRQAELTGTRFWVIWKSELILVPIVLVASIFFANFIWGLAPIPGPQYPFAETMWEFNAANQAVIQSATLGRYSPFQEAFKPPILLAGAGFGLLLFMLMSFLRLPMMFIYGLLRGLNQTLPHVVIPQFLGAMVGRYYFEKRLGLKWRDYVPVVAAGFACGVGLVTVLGIGILFLAQSVIKITY